MSRIGYIRVSATDQNTGRQIEMLQGVTDKLFVEKVSGKNIDRPELQKMMAYVREGDKLIVESISRFGRNTLDILNLVAELDQKKVEFISLKENIETSTPFGRAMLGIFASFAQLEREYTLERQREGIALAKKNNKHIGRPRAQITKQFKAAYHDLKDGKVNVKTAVYLSGYKYDAFKKLCREYEETQNKRD